MIWILTASYWVHLITTVLWLGSLAISAVVAFPAWKSGSMTNNQWVQLQRKLLPLINVSMVLIWISGFIQMTQDEQYNGFLAVDSTWAIALLAKHLTIFGMMGITLYTQFRLYPAVDRLQFLAQKKAELAETQLTDLVQQDGKLLRINTICAVLVLLCTAVATAT